MIQDSPVGCKLNGFFRGEVIQHLTHGYCKIFIPSIHPIEWRDQVDLIPPAEQASSLFAGTNNGSGEFTYPNIGSIVWVFFANNDQNYPVYFASSLGGQNAFGQYEVVKSSSEAVSERHLITSGKTHIEWYENGKISAIVVDPDRRYAEVNYNNTYIGQISDDQVSARPVVASVDNEDISSIDCQLVLDNHEFNGTISCGTHYFDPRESHVTTYLSDEQKTIIEKTTSESRYDTANVTQNDSLHAYTAMSSLTQSFDSNVTDAIQGSTTQIKDSGSEEFHTTFSTNGKSNILLASENTRSGNNIYTKQQGDMNATSSLVQEKYIGNSFELDENGNGGVITKQEMDYALMKSNCPDTLEKILSYEAENSVTIKDGNLEVNNISAVNKMSDSTKGIVSLTSDIENSIKLKNYSGSSFTSRYNFTKVASTTEKQTNKTTAKISNSSGAKIDINLHGMKNSNGNLAYDTTYKHTIESSSAKQTETFIDAKNKVEFRRIVDDASGTFEVTLTDSKTKKLSQLTFDKSGNITLTGSTNLKICIGNGTILQMDQSGSISIISPNNDVKIQGNTNINGTLHVTQTITSDADVVASNCTLNTHVHQVPPHCPSSGITLVGQ